MSARTRRPKKTKTKTRARARPPARPARPSHPGKREIKTLIRVLGSEVAAERLGVARRTVQQWAQFGPPPERRGELGRVVITHRERLDAEAKKSHGLARSKRQVKAPRDAIGWNKTGTVETQQYRGVVSNVRTNMLVNDRNEEKIVHRILKEAQKVERKTKSGAGAGGRFYVTFGMVEFGIVTGSGGKRIRSVTKGELGGMAAYTTFASTTSADRTKAQFRPEAARDLAGLEEQVRALVHRVASNAGGSSVLDSFTVKRYQQKEEGEVGSTWKTRKRKK